MKCYQADCLERPMHLTHNLLVTMGDLMSPPEKEVMLLAPCQSQDKI